MLVLFFVRTFSPSLVLGGPGHVYLPLGSKSTGKWVVTTVVELSTPPPVQAVFRGSVKYIARWGALEHMSLQDAVLRASHSQFL